MTSRYKPNEPESPVSLELLALLLRSPEERVAETVRDLPDQQRAALAIHCVARTHMRQLAMLIAAECTEQALWQAGGRVGEVLFEQCQDRAAFDREPGPQSKRKVSLAKVA
jgi:hypothetical protein